MLATDWRGATALDELLSAKKKGRNKKEPRRGEYGRALAELEKRIPKAKTGARVEKNDSDGELNLSEDILADQLGARLTGGTPRLPFLSSADERRRTGAGGSAGADALNALEMLTRMMENLR